MCVCGYGVGFIPALPLFSPSQRLYHRGEECCFAEKSGVQEYNKITWDTESVPSLPLGKGEKLQAGLAGAYSAVVKLGEEEVLVLAGGANFSKKPLINAFREGVAPEKIYHDDIYILRKKDGKYEWTLSETQLPNGAGYGASIPVENGFLIVGGEVVDSKTGKKSASKRILRLTLNAEGKVTLKKEKDAAVAFVKGGSFLQKSKAYFVGGMQDGVMSNDVQILDLETNEWTKGTPYPGHPRVEPVVAAQAGGFKNRAQFYLFSGYTKIDGAMTALTDGYAFLPKKGEEKAVWVKTADIIPHGQDKGIGLLGASSAKIGLRPILFFGG